MPNKKVLFLVEGKRTEPSIIGDGNGHIGCFNLSSYMDYQVIVFGTAIYELKDVITDIGVDAFDLISYLVNEKGLAVDIPDGTPLRNAFSAIYLIFDYDPHYQKFSTRDIEFLVDFFNNETENGKIFVNYPMVESMFHIKKDSDDFASSKICTDKKVLSSYKDIVQKETIFKRRNHIDDDNRRNITICHYNKAKNITQSKTQNIEQREILSVQNKMLQKNNEIFILSSIPLLILEYNFDKVIKQLDLVFDGEYLKPKRTSCKK